MEVLGLHGPTDCSEEDSSEGYEDHWKVGTHETKEANKYKYFPRKLAR